MSELMILISGGGSQLGLNTARALVARGQKVVITTRRRNDALSARVAEQSAGAITVEVLDLVNSYEIGALMARYNFQQVIHTATAHVWADTLAANIPSYGMMFNMLEAANSAGVARFVLCNSFVVYRGVEPPFREDQPLPPEFTTRKIGNVFDNTPSLDVTAKRCIEAITLDYGMPTRRPRQPLMETVSLRLPGQCGPFYNSMFNPIAKAVHAYALGKREILDQPFRPFSENSYALDNADAVATVTLAETLSHRIYNVSGGIAVTARDILAAFYRLFPDAEAFFGLKLEDQPDERSNAVIDTSRIREDLGWAPRYDLDAMLRDYVAWIRAGNPY